MFREYLVRIPFRIRQEGTITSQKDIETWGDPPLKPPPCRFQLPGTECWLHLCFLCSPAFGFFRFPMQHHYRSFPKIIIFWHMMKEKINLSFGNIARISEKSRKLLFFRRVPQLFFPHVSRLCGNQCRSINPPKPHATVALSLFIFTCQKRNRTDGGATIP